jgi:hypothetical protein
MIHKALTEVWLNASPLWWLASAIKNVDERKGSDAQRVLCPTAGIAWPRLTKATWTALAALGPKTFAVVERDDQSGTDARIKRLYTFTVTGLAPQTQGGTFPVLTKTLVRNLLPALRADSGPVLEKVEGLTVTADGHVLIVTDNDGVDDSSGETQLLDLGILFE